MNNWNEIDPDWAWTPYEPADGKLSRAEAAHLYRRTSLGAPIGTLDEDSLPTLSTIVDGLLTSETDPTSLATNPLVRSTLATGNAQKLSAWWVYRLLTTDAPCREVTTLFWHGHFATSAEKVTNVNLMHRQYQLLREHAFGDFGELVQGISQDPAMLIYLDSVTNRKAHPNENYAREVMELFCLGEGHYTETDIRELARCFTGWEVRREKFRFNRYQHDFGEKTVFKTSGEMGGEEGVDVVLKQPTMPRFIISKLIRYFMADEVHIPERIIVPLADQFRREGLQIRSVLRTILTSNLFFSNYCIARKVRSPVSFALGLLRTLQGTANTIALSEGLAQLGQELFFPPNVKGWDGGRAWINSSTLLARANLIRRLLDSKETRFDGDSLSDLADKLGATSGSEIVDWWEAALLAVPLSDSVRDQIAESIEKRGDREGNLRNALHFLTALPEYQLA